MTRTTSTATTVQDRDQRVLATLAQQRGRIDDALVDDAHAPDAIDHGALGHCRVTVQTTLSDGRLVSA